MFGIGTQEMILFGIIAVILFGGRLPSVARSLGKSIVEFKKGMTRPRERGEDVGLLRADERGRIQRPKRTRRPALRAAEGVARSC